MPQLEAIMQALEMIVSRISVKQVRCMLTVRAHNRVVNVSSSISNTDFSVSDI